MHISSQNATPTDGAEVGADQPEQGEEENNDEEEEEEEEEDDDIRTETVISAQEFDFREFVLRFACKSVCSSAAVLLMGYRANTDFTNHCIAKLFHRIAFDCKMPSTLFQVCIFR